MRKNTTNLLTLICVTTLLFFSCKKDVDSVADQLRVNGTSSQDFYLEKTLSLQKRITHDINANVGGYLEALPASYSNYPEKKYPVIIYLHGKGGMGSGSYNDLDRVEGNAIPKLLKKKEFPANFTVDGKTYQFIVISPQFKGWPSSPDVNAVVEYVKKKYRVDEKRIYMGGQSMGGGNTWDYVVSYGKKIAAIVPIAGASWPTEQKGAEIAASGVCVWAFHGKDDTTVPSWYSVSYVNYINLCNPLEPALLTLFTKGEHSVWNTATDPNYRENGKNIYEWMLSTCNTN